jgi:hypothetical protein
MKSRFSFHFFEAFRNHFLIKLTILGSIFNLKCIRMTKLEILFLLKGGFHPKFQHYGICKFSYKKPKISILNPKNHIKDYIM